MEGDERSPGGNGQDDNWNPFKKMKDGASFWGQNPSFSTLSNLTQLYAFLSY